MIRRIRIPDWLLGLLLSALFAASLNIQTFAALRSQPQLIASLGLTATDLAYYAALIRSVADGNWSLGNISLREHRADSAQASIAPLLQGAARYVTGADLLTVIVWGDVLFPLLTFLILYLGLTALFRSRIIRACATFFALAPISFGLLRLISPQLTLPLFLLLSVLVLRNKSSWQSLLLRGVLLSILVYVQVFYALFFFACEGIFLLLALRRGVTWRSFLLQAAATVGLPGIAACSKYVLAGTGDQSASADTLGRLGVIGSHVPSAPGIQIFLLLTLLGWFLVSRMRRNDVVPAERMLPVFLIAGFLVLCQPLLHGREVMFGLYYRMPLFLLLRIIWFWLIVRFLRAPSRTATVVSVFLAVWVVTSFIIGGFRQQRADMLRASRSVTSDFLETLSFLGRMSGERIVLAPYPVADLIPVFTSHFVSFNTYARYQYGSDRELADRYLLQETFFPTPPEHIDRTYNLVFGLSAGNAAARARNACIVSRLFSGTWRDCRADIRAHIVHQDILALLDRSQPDIPGLLSKYAVDTIVTTSPLPSEVSPRCTQIQKIGPYMIHMCGLSQ